jgi:diguanylate cyclase (GGDEF)-like protein
VICLGLDGFSKFNETYGFAMGDRILRDLGSWVKRSVRTCDLVARPGGDQFFILLPETGVEGGLIVAEKLRRGSSSSITAADRSGATGGQSNNAPPCRSASRVIPSTA